MRVLIAFIKKEFLQIMRDPSTIIIAFILPTMLSLIFMYGINMDAVKVKIGLQLQDANPQLQSLAQGFTHSEYLDGEIFIDKNKMYNALVASKIQGAIVVPTDFTKNLKAGRSAEVFVLTDGSESNSAAYVQTYAMGIINQWAAEQGYVRPSTAIVTPIMRVWYNQEVNSHHFILPGSLAITLSLVGLLLTALVVAREWERGTMEALLSTNLRPYQFVAGKYFAYYVLGMGSMAFNVFLCVTAFEVPFRGSYLILFAVGGLFLISCMGIGLSISSVFKNQFLCSQLALSVGFLPALLLSGLLFPINSMPPFFRYLTAVLPQRYFVTFIESEFLAGTIWSVVLINTVFLGVLSIGLLALVYSKTPGRLQ